MTRVPTEHEFAAHVSEVESRLEVALGIAAERGRTFDAMLIHSGTMRCYAGDDAFIPFRVSPDFQRRCPIGGAGHVLVYRPGERTKLLRHVPADFWHDATPPLPENVAATLDVMDVADTESAAEHCREIANAVVIGDAPEFAERCGHPECPSELRSALDEARVRKTPFEIDCIREANRRTAPGFEALRKAFGGGANERELFSLFLEKTGAIESELPYSSIIAWDENAAILHHMGKDSHRPKRAFTLLVDAGVSFHGWAADVTRTWTWDSTPEPFRKIVSDIDALTRELAVDASASVDFVDLHRRAQRRVAEIVTEIGVVRCSADEAYEKGVHRYFFPHGLGHLIGLLVHDSGGHQRDAHGTHRKPPADATPLRTTRILEPGMVVTIEPGLYFIPMLLDRLRAEHGSSLLDDSLLETLLPCGGVRIEDDIAVHEAGPENLTRPFIA